MKHVYLFIYLSILNIFQYRCDFVKLESEMVENREMTSILQLKS